MSVGRIASGYQAQRARSIVQSNQRSMARLQEQASSGQKIIRPSDNPLALNRLLDITATTFTDQRYLDNIQAGLSELNTTDSVLTDMNDVLQRAIEVGTQGATFTSAQSSMTAIANEVDQLVNQMVQLGNTKLGDKYLFGGLQTQQPPFARANDTVTYTGTAATEPFARQVEISQGVRVTLNAPGDSLVGSVTSAGAPLAVTGGAGPIETLMRLKQNLLAGDQDEVRLRLDELKADQQSLLAQQAQLGAVANRMQLTENRLEDRKAVLAQQYGSLQNVDLPQLVTDLNYQENILNASLGVLGRVMGTSLLDYI